MYSFFKVASQRDRDNICFKDCSVIHAYVISLRQEGDYGQQTAAHNLVQISDHPHLKL